MSPFPGCLVACGVFDIPQSEELKDLDLRVAWVADVMRNICCEDTLEAQQRLALSLRDVMVFSGFLTFFLSTNICVSVFF